MLCVTVISSCLFFHQFLVSHWARSIEQAGRQPERIWVTNRWPTGGRKAPGHQTPALPRISKNRQAGNFYAIWGGAWFLKIDGHFDLDE